MVARPGRRGGHSRDAGAHGGSDTACENLAARAATCRGRTGGRGPLRSCRRRAGGHPSRAARRRQDAALHGHDRIICPFATRTGDIEARVFFIAYTLDGVADPSKRPLTFSFNGGPGSSSVWLHLGALGPQARARCTTTAPCRRRRIELVDNDATWLDQTDLVFIDPVGTGYSRADEARAGQASSGACRATSSRWASSSAST